MSPGTRILAMIGLLFTLADRPLLPRQPTGQPLPSVSPSGGATVRRPGDHNPMVSTVTLTGPSSQTPIGKDER